MESTVRERRRTRGGVPSGGRFAVEPATESAVELHPPVDNRPAAVAARQLERRRAFAEAHAGERCPRSGMPASINWDSKPQLVTMKRNSGFLRGTMLCIKCGNAGALVQRTWSGPGDRRSFTWFWIDHPVPRTK